MPSIIQTEKKIIGRRELVAFPEWNLFGLEAKIDTGAYTSALHCKEIYVKIIENVPTLFFRLLDESHPEYSNEEHSFSKFTKKMVKSSFGEQEERYIIKTGILFGKRKIICSISLTDRTNMRYPVLIGRKTIKGKFVVDVSKKFILGE